MSSIFDKTTDALAASLKFRNLRQEVTASNIANADTPGFHAKKVDFEEALQRAIDLKGLPPAEAAQQDPDDFAIGSGSIGDATADIYDNPVGNTTNDGNSVDMEAEMANMQENTILYKAALQLINKKLAAIRYAVTEGGR